MSSRYVYIVTDEEGKLPAFAENLKKRHGRVIALTVCAVIAIAIAVPVFVDPKNILPIFLLLLFPVGGGAALVVSLTKPWDVKFTPSELEYRKKDPHGDFEQRYVQLNA